MSKRKIAETVTAARNARAKKARTHEEPLVPLAEEKPAETKPKRRKKAEAKPKAPKEDLVVFAFRLKAAERDLIHKAAGAAKASRYVRALTIAASKGDEKTVVEIVRAVKEEMAAAS